MSTSIKSAPSGSKFLIAQRAWNTIRSNPNATKVAKQKVKDEYRRAGRAVARELSGRR